MTYSPIIQNIPCTLVTGFLGAGKTTVINQLLSAKAADECWALLINEFGRIGIDGTLLSNEQDNNNIAIREVSGGCICCTSQLPLQIAISRLLSDHRPQRLIIEPTGLAHPRELSQQLSAPHWQTALKMQAVITVLSANQWQQEKYRTHTGFQAHVRDADVVVINRYQQLSDTCQQDLQQWVHTLNPQVSIIWSATSDIKNLPDNEALANKKLTDLAMTQLTAQLSQPSTTISKQRQANTNQARISTNQARISLTLPTRLAASPLAIPDDNTDIKTDNELPYRYHNQQLDMSVGGWRLPANWVFAADELQQWLVQRPNWQRIKGVVHTTDGWQQLNFTPDSLTSNTTSAQIDSRLEIILLSQDSINRDNNNDADSQQDVTDKDQLQKLWATWDRELMALVI